MISLEEAQQRVLALGTPVSTETLPLSRAVGRFATGDILALRSQPAHAMSAMDGYAVLASAGLSMWTVIGESAAGSAFTGALKRGEAVRIFTGAPLPAGADCVLIQENVERLGDTITLTSEARLKPGVNIRSLGADFKEGDVLVAQGQKITATRVGLLAAGGHARVTVRRPVRVALLSTGNELVPVGAPVGPNQLPASNAVMLQALLDDPHVVVDDLGIAKDSTTSIVEMLGSAPDADILVTIGGASVGDYDLVRPALLALDAKVDFWKVAIRPGKPLIAGRIGDQAFLGLPGNPVSAYVTALLFLKPLIEYLSGAISPFPLIERLPLAGTLPQNGDRTDHIRAIIRNGCVSPIKTQDSAGLAALAIASALIVRAPGVPASGDGDNVDVIRF